VQTLDLIVHVDVHYPGPECAGFSVGQRLVGDNDDRIADTYQVRGSTVDANNATAAHAFDHVGLQTRAIGDIHHRDLFARQDVSRVEQGSLDGDRPDEVKVGMRNGRTVNFAAEHGPVHGASPL